MKSKGVSKIRTVAQLHHEAMDVYDLALEAERVGDHESFLLKCKIALELESEAARVLAPMANQEPTRSVIHRGAATLALRCGEFRQAERLISTALSGNPHDEIADELRNLLEQVNFDRHMAVQGLRLAANEFQISLVGDSVGYGIADSEDVVGRIQVAEKLVTRTVERRIGRPFRESGKPSKEIAEKCRTYLSVARPGSFAVTMRVGLPDDQLLFKGFDNEARISPQETVRDMIDCLVAYNSHEKERLKRLIPDPTYHRNFIALARQMAPDGKRVKLVGITTDDGSELRKVAMDTPKWGASQAKTERQEGERVIVGKLLYADSTTKRDTIKLVSDDNRPHRIHVPAGMISDVVRPLWDQNVKATVVPKGKSRTQIELVEIDPIPDPSRSPEQDSPKE